MPVVAVIAAVAIDSIAVSAAIAGTLTTLSAITAIGATLGAIGQITHNKTLSLVGAGIGLVGGIGALAFGSDALGNVSDLFGTTSGGATDVAGGVGAASEAGGAGAVTVTDLPPAAADITTATGGVVNADPAGLINSSLAPAEGSAAGIVTGGDTAGALSQSLSPGATAGATAGGTPDFMSAFNKTFGTLPDGTVLTDAVSKGGGAGGILNWAKNNQMLAYGVLQSGGSFISGLTNPMTPAQIDALNSQSRYNDAAAALAIRQSQNMASGMPTATVTGKPVAQSSLINNSPLKASPVTGSVNNSSTYATGATS